MGYQKEKTCCFTGHRRLPFERIDHIKLRLEEIIEDLVVQGVENFMFGGAIGFDTTAVLCALSVREKFSHIKIILILPCRNQSYAWRQKDIDVYNWILSQADEHLYIAQEYDASCMHRRNRYLVDHSGYCVCYLTERRGGTYSTVCYAKKQGVSLIKV